MIDLWAELRPALADRRTDAELLKYGVIDHDARALCGLTSIQAFGRFYEPNTDGQPVIIVPILDGDELCDLLCFDLDRPAEWFVRLGGEPLLGACALSDQLLGKPLHIYRTPLSWLRAGCDGVVILDPNRAYIDLVTAQYGLVGEDEAHTDELRRIMTETAMRRLPRFLIRDEAA